MRSGRLAQGLTRLRQVRQDHGLGAALVWMADRVGRPLVDLRVHHFLSLELDELRLPTKEDPQFTFRFLRPEEVRAFAEDPANLLTGAFAERVAAGLDLCFSALAGPQLAAYGWYALDGVEPEHCMGTALSYPPQIAYMYHGFTHPDFRGKRLHGLCIALAMKRLADQGIRRFVATVDWTNWASLRSCSRVGFRRLGYLVAFRLGPLPLAVYPRAARRLGIRFGGHAQPRPQPPPNDAMLSSQWVSSAHH